MHQGEIKHNGTDRIEKLRRTPLKENVSLAKKTLGQRFRGRVPDRAE